MSAKVKTCSSPSGLHHTIARRFGSLGDVVDHVVAEVEVRGVVEPEAGEDAVLVVRLVDVPRVYVPHLVPPIVVRGPNGRRSVERFTARAAFSCRFGLAIIAHPALSPVARGLVGIAGMTCICDNRASDDYPPHNSHNTRRHDIVADPGSLRRRAIPLGSTE